MCGRFSLDPQNWTIADMLKKLPPESPPVKTGEVFPTDTCLVLMLKDGEMEPEAMAWGFPRFDGKGVVINARSETALQKPMFRKALLTRPCVISTTGFFEWKALQGKKKKDKYIFRQPGEEVLYLAGMWSIFSEEHGPILEHFTILTADADQFMREYHDRMPVILHSDERLPWLLGKNRDKILSRKSFKLDSKLIVSTQANLDLG